MAYELISENLMLPDLLKLSHHVWMDYDEEAQVLYLSFRRPQQANDSVMEGNQIYHYDDDESVGITFLNFSTA